MKTLFFIFIFLSSFLHATIINVPTPYATIQAGITAAANTDTVLVQPGTYVENINFIGKLITVGSMFLTTQDTTYISSTIIDGNSSGSVVTFENSENSSAVLCGFIITNGYAYEGGGISFSGSSPSFVNVTITGNSASYSGGGIYCVFSSPSLQNVTISGNTAYGSLGYGGGICCDDYSSPCLDNVTIGGNSAIRGAGISCSYNSNPILQNVTITGNTASYGGGIICFNSNPVLINSILWNNSPQEIQIASGSVTATYSDIEGGWTGTGNIDSDPLFVDAGSGDYHLQSTSPCIDAGDPTSPLDPDGTIADMGAYYFHQLPPDADFTADTTNGDAPLTVNFTDLSVQGSGVIDEWYWEFGDGNNSSMQNPVNEYLLPGNYTVSLTVTDVNDFTDSETKIDYITVNPPAYIGPVWHISTTGSDVWGNGAEQYPFATIQHGINSSSNTDTVLVQSGTYVENINYDGKLITVGSLFLTTQDTTYISSTIIDGNNSGGVVVFGNGEDSTAVLSGFTITNGSYEFSGGGIYCNDSSPILRNLTITSNSAGFFGGGIYIGGGSPILQNLTIISNSADRGGGIFCEDSSLSLQNVTITGNSAAYGGGIYCDDSSPSFENIIIMGNSASYSGGGIFCYYYSSPSLLNVTITANSASVEGGGIYCQYNSNPSLENVTVTGNSASADGGGIYCYASYPILINSILWNDLPQEIYLYSGSVTATYSDIQDGWTGTGIMDDDPLFVDAGSGDYRLQSTSPCIDAGDPASPLDPDGTIADMGAYYFHQHFGPVWHISTTGSDLTGNGSEQFPFATIQYGINASSNTDTVLVQPGSYVENINFYGKLITVGSLFLTTQNTTYISTTTIDGNSSGSVVSFDNSENSSAILCGFTITNGSNYNYGGGIFCSYSSPILQNLTIISNSAEEGGGICCVHSSPSLQNVTISGNTAYESLGLGSGGGICCYSSSPNLESVTITGNSAEGMGGGIFSNNSSPNLENVTITGNSADFGGGIFCYSSSPNLENVTITSNSAGYGGSIFCDSSSPSLINSILWNDSPQEIYIFSGSVTVTYSDIEDGWAGTGNIDSDPLFVNPAIGDYHLQSTSPCIDAGDPASPLDPDGTIADMGAFYFHQTIAPDPPQNVTVEIIGTDVHLNWDAVTGANSYKVYSSDDPYTGFVEDTSGSFAGESWSAPIGDVKKFYYVIASTEITRSKDSHLQDAYQPGRRSRGYDSDKFKK